MSEAIRALWRLAGPHRRDLRLGVMVRSGQALCAGVPLALLVRVIDDLRDGQLTASRSWAYTVVVAASVVGQLAFAYLSNRLLWASCYRLGRDLRARGLDRLRALPARFHADARRATR